MFGNKNKILKKRYIELAGMLKEAGKGSINMLEKIKTRFALQEGVRAERVNEYVNMLEGAGLLTFIHGDKGWKYNVEEEWNMFKINI